MKKTCLLVFMIYFLIAFAGCNTLKKQPIITDPISNIDENETPVVSDYENGDRHIYFINNGNKNGTELYLSTNGDIKAFYWENGRLKDKRIFLNNHTKRTFLEIRVDKAKFASITGWVNGKKEGAELLFKANGDISLKMWVEGEKHGKSFSQRGEKNCIINDWEYEKGKVVASDLTFNNDCEINKEKMYEDDFFKKLVELINLYIKVHKEL